MVEVPIANVRHRDESAFDIHRVAIAVDDVHTGMLVQIPHRLADRSGYDPGVVGVELGRISPRLMAQPFLIA
jgi:hypothetical protein